jgi:LDH2 family malate/lactate/ureidoglycolate dehydrogenase
VFMQVLDPEAFGGVGAFKRLLDHLADAANASRPRLEGERVRLPGERGLQRYRDAVTKGVALYPTILPALRTWADKYRVALPRQSN